MEAIAERVARRVIADATEVMKRIETIPGWDRSNFLRSVHDQVRRGRPLSEKQVAVLTKIEREQSSRAPAKPAHADYMLRPAKQYVDHSDYMAIVQLLRKKSPVTVYDPRGLIAPNQKIPSFIIDQLTTDFYGRAEQYAEYNADEDDPERRQLNSEIQHDSEKAAEEMSKAHVDIKQEGPITKITITPSYPHILEKHHGIK